MRVCVGPTFDPARHFGGRNAHARSRSELPDLLLSQQLELNSVVVKLQSKRSSKHILLMLAHHQRKRLQLRRGWSKRGTQEQRQGFTPTPLTLPPARAGKKTVQPDCRFTSEVQNLPPGMGKHPSAWKSRRC
ncbi:uncharacterized protein LOC111947089 isoform X2 [Oryzias latipes]